MFNQRKHKQFNYKPRFQNSNDVKTEETFESKWDAVKPKTKRRKSVLTSLPVLLIMLAAIIIFMYILNGYMD